MSVAFLGGCSGPREAAAPILLPVVAERAEKPCPEPRPQVCTMEYAPTCGLHADGSREQYASPCNACADDRVVATLIGACPE
ncbi:MAG: hypothetical protein R3E54_15810 [Halioglobus sp.]